MAGIETGREDAAVVQAILALARGLDIDVVAEGIETVGQCQLLRLLGSTYGQGYLFARPCPAGEVSLAAAGNG